jgi:glycosyltransferase involved in cell wall biosynthesis
MISKYPPIEGGVSSDNYWLAKSLGEKGHEIFVVTNAWEVEEDYREKINKNELCFLEPKNVSVHSTIKDFRPPILRSHYYTEKLINLAVDIIRDKGADIIYSHYILPYGIVGFNAKYITKKPHIIRHAGSDIGRLYKSRFLQTIFIEALKNADKIIGGNNILRIFKAKGINTNNVVKPISLINPNYFNPHAKVFDLSSSIKDLDVPIFSYFGKISELKKTYSFVNAASRIKNKKFILLFVVGVGKKVEELKKYVASVGLKDKCVFLPFQPPWKIPSLMRASTCIVSPESEETPFLPKNTHYPKIIREAMACGKCAIIGRGMSKKGIYASLLEGKDILVVDPNNINQFKSKLEYIIDNPSIAEEIGKNAYKFSKKNENFEGGIKRIEKLLFSVLQNNGFNL